MSAGMHVLGILSKLQENITTAIQQLSDDIPSLNNDNFNKDAFWNNFTGVTKLVSHEASKFCMMFSKQPLPSSEECQFLANKMESTCLSFVTVFFTLPKLKGKTLHREIRLYILSVLEGIKDLCAAAKCQSSRQLQIVGNIWEKCEAVETLPKDNRDAVLAICQEQHGMVADAVQELMDAIVNSAIAEQFEPSETQDQISPPETWAPPEQNVILPCSGLIKAAKACLKKIRDAIFERGNGDDEISIAELDTIADAIKDSSSLVDDLVSNLYPPLNHSVVRHQASLIRSHFKDLVSIAGSCHFCSGADTTWIEFLKKAIDHNWVKINDMVLAD